MKNATYFEQVYMANFEKAQVEGPNLIGYLNGITDRYGIAAGEFLDLFAAQAHRCAVCRKNLTMFAENLAEAPVVDHDHATGAVRGILCRGCNTAVGYIEKDRVRTRRVLGYLRRATKKPDETWAQARAAGRGWARGRRQEQKLLTVLDESEPAD